MGQFDCPNVIKLQGVVTKCKSALSMPHFLTSTVHPIWNFDIL